MDDDDDGEGIFGDLGVAEIRTSQRSLADKLVADAWKRWVELTERPKATPNARFKKVYKNLLDMKYNNERLMRSVEGAAYLPPHKRDPSDVGRLINALQYNTVEAEAMSLLDSGVAPIYKWSWDDELEILASVPDVEEACNIPLGLWSSYQHEYAGYLITSMNRDEIIQAAERVRMHIGEDSVFPSEVVRHHNIWGKSSNTLKVANKASRSTYESGVKEAEALEGMDTEVDVSAGRLMLAGCPIRVVKLYHLEAPEGYWARVIEYMTESPDTTLKGIYTDLEQEYDGWNPSDRERPKW